MSSILPMTTKEERQKVRAQLGQIYDAYRTALMNCIYYERRLRRVQRLSKGFEIGLAVLNSSVVGAWLIWKGDWGSIAWKTLSGTACLCAIAHPLLKLPVEIERLTKQRTSYNDLYHDLRVIVREIQANQCISSQSWKTFQKADERWKKIAETDDVAISKKSLAKIMEEVIVQIPTASLWHPQKPQS